jgi:hypothetical protein
MRIYMPVDLLIYGYFHTLVMFNSAVYTLLLTTANFAISDSDGSTLLLVDLASKRGYYVLDHFVLVSQRQSICYQEDRFDERPSICHSI